MFVVSFNSESAFNKTYICIYIIFVNVFIGFAVEKKFAVYINTNIHSNRNVTR